MAYDEHRLPALRRNFSLALRLVSTALAVISGVVYVAGYRRETALVVLLIGLAKAFESVSDVFYGLFLCYERMERMAASTRKCWPMPYHN